MSRLMNAALVAATAVLAGGIASADMSKAVIGAFKGQLVVSKGDLPEGKNDKDTIAKIKAENQHELVGEAHDDVTRWSFHYTAFLNKTGATTLRLEFYKDGGKQLSADKRLDGVDPKSAILTGDITIDEDEGLAKGKTYDVKLVTSSDTVVASTKLTMK